MSPQSQRNEGQLNKETKEEAEREREELLERIDNWLDAPMAILAVVWVIIIVLELAIPLPPDWAAWIFQLDTLIWIAFLIEFLVELIIAPNKLLYFQTHWLVALSVALPFFRVVRIVPAINALRGLSLLGILIGVNRATRAAAQLFAQNRLQYVILIDSIVVLVGAAAVYYFERGARGTNINTFSDALWWAAALITTINVSLEPVTLEGRIVAFLIRLVALATFGYITASIASFLVGRGVGRERADSEAEEEMAKERDELLRLRGEVTALREAVEKLQRQLDKIAQDKP